MRFLVRQFHYVALLATMISGSVHAQSSDVAGPEDFTAWASEIGGAYQIDSERHLVLMPHTHLQILSLFDSETGMARPLEYAAKDTFSYGPTVVAMSPVEGRVIILRAEDGGVEGLRWERNGQPDMKGSKIPLMREAVRFQNGREADLAGWLIRPPGSNPVPVAVIIPSGENDRFFLWRVTMTLAVEGIGSLVYDRRNVGESTGEPLPDHYWHASQELAEDAAAAVRFVQGHPGVKKGQVGVLGWSQGGWLGAVVAAREELAFYVNIAGNANPGWQQQRWNMLSTLRWEGFTTEEVLQAQQFLDSSYFAVRHGEISWAEYQRAEAANSDKHWFDRLSDFSLWESESQIAEELELEKHNVPEHDFEKVSVPTLGIFFELDESSPPATPLIFLRGRLRGENPDVTIRVFPNTTHEAFVVPSFPTQEQQTRITNLDPGVFAEIREWVASRVTFD